MLLQQRRQLRKRAHCIVDKYYLCSHMPQSKCAGITLDINIIIITFYRYSLCARTVHTTRGVPARYIRDQ